MKPVDFGDYTLLKKLATGGMGEVFLARQEQGAGFERYVAIKRILPELSGDDDFVKMFLDEARLAARLNHPNVVQIYDLGICGEQYYIAMEFLEGRDLRRIMGRLGSQDRALPGAHAVQIVHGAAEGLHYAHELKDAYGDPLKIIHRDVSPQNIFISFHGTIKVLDFGIAKAEARSVRTRTGGLKGKYPYLSPEQVRGDEIDRRSDVFSIGTVLWEITVGRRLFKRENDLLTLQAVLACEVPRPSELMNNYPPELEAIVMKSLASDPDKRYANCRVLQEELEQFVGQYGLVLSPQKLGKFSKNLFSNEPQTVTDILESLKIKPTSKSLLHESEEDSESFSQQSLRPAFDQSEQTDASESVIDRNLLARAANFEPSTSEEASSSHSSAASKRPDQGTSSHAEAPRASAGVAALGDGLGLVDMFSDLGDVNLSAQPDLGVSPVAPSVDPMTTPIWAPQFEVPAQGDAIPPTTDDTVELNVDDLGEAEDLADESAEVGDEDGSHAIARAPTAVVSLPDPQPMMGGPPPPVSDQHIRAIARAPTALNNAIAALPPDEAALGVTPSHGTESPPLQQGMNGTATPSGSIEPVVVPPDDLTEVAVSLPGKRRTTDVMSIVRQWPRATIIALIGAVVLPFALVISIVSFVDSGSSAVSGQEPLSGGGDRTGPNTNLVSSIAQPAADAAAGVQTGVVDSSVEPPPTPDAGLDMSFSAEAGPLSGDADAFVPLPPLVDVDGEPLPPIVDGEPLPPEGTVEPGNTSRRSSMGIVRISTAPGGLRVLVDNHSIGTSPVTATLTPGSHRVTVRGTGVEYSAQIRVVAGERRHERIVVPRGTLVFAIRPYADVFIDGRHVGLTPMPPQQLAAGRHRLRLVNDNLNRAIHRTVTIRPGQRTTLSLNMADTP